MTATPLARHNPDRPGAAPALSVLVPFAADDPGALLGALDGASGVEFIALADGAEAALCEQVARRIAAMTSPARLLRLATNRGRAAARNLLAFEARGRHLLFLDADMAPGDDGFLDRWLTFARTADPAIAFGGFRPAPVRAGAPGALHAAMARARDCPTSAARARAAARHVFACNLLVRRDVIAAIPFDEGFGGWGWEDVAWALDAAGRYPIVHLDNPASHLGLDPPAALLAKYEQSAATFARLLARHHEAVRDWPVTRAARLVRALPGRARWRPWLRRAALSSWPPLAARALALRLYRAALYADVLP